MDGDAGHHRGRRGVGEPQGEVGDDSGVVEGGIGAINNPVAVLLVAF